MIFNISKTLLICSSLLMTVQIFAQVTPGVSPNYRLRTPPRINSEFERYKATTKTKNFLDLDSSQFIPENTPLIQFDPFSYGNGVLGFCGTPKSEFSKIASKFDTASCYENNKNSDPDPDQKLSHKDSMWADVYTCRCLYDKAIAGWLMKPRTNFNSHAIDMEVVPESSETVNKNLGTTQMLGYTGNSIEAGWSLAAQNSRATATASATATGRAISGIQQTMATHFENNHPALGKPLDGVGIEKVKNTITDASLIETPAVEIHENSVSNTVPEGHCISGREFIAFKSLPQDDIIFKELGSSSFSPSEWNYTNLRSKYDEIMSFPIDQRKNYQQEILKLKSKIHYLDANPLIKTVFAAEENSATTKLINDQIKDPKINKRVQESMSASSILKTKTDLFNILQDFADVKNKCFGKSNECLEEASKNGKTAKLYSNLKKFIEKPAVKDIQIFDQGHKKASKNGEKPFSKPENWTRDGILSYFKSKNPTMASPSTCLKKSGVDTVECMTIFADYCPVAESAYSETFRHEIDDDLKDDVDLHFSSMFDIKDLDKNEHFLKLNAEICNTPRKVSPTDEKAFTFFDFKKEYCGVKPQPRECNSNEGSEVQKIRAAYMEKFKHPLSSNALAFNEVSDQVEIKSFKLADVTNHQQGFSRFEDLFDFSHFGGSRVPEVKLKQDNNFLNSLAEYANEKTKSQNDNSNSEISQSYTSTFNSNSEQPQVAEATKIENLSDNQRSNLLDDWKEELSQFKKEQTVSSDSSAHKFKEDALNEKIATLEALLAQQKKLTESQYKLLNDAIAAQSRKVDEDQETTSEVTEPQRVHQRRSQNFAQADHAFNESTGRFPASVKDFQNDMGGNAASGGGPATIGKGRSGTNALSDGASNDSSVERENAKLVNLRQNSNGSITIEAKGNSGLVPNAIAVPISDDLYKMAQMNPTGLNLFQIEKNIPKEHIAELEKKEYIILLLQNGKNPPLEVKVKKENNRLVQVKNTQIVSRTFSLEGLKNSLRQ